MTKSTENPAARICKLISQLGREEGAGGHKSAKRSKAESEGKVLISGSGKRVFNGTTFFRASNSAMLSVDASVLLERFGNCCSSELGLLQALTGLRLRLLEPVLLGLLLLLRVF